MNQGHQEDRRPGSILPGLFMFATDLGKAA